MTIARFDDEPPNDIRAEQIVLGAMMDRPAQIPVVAEILGPCDFYRPAHQIIAEAIAELHAEASPTGAVAVSERLASRRQIGLTGGAPYLLDLLSAVPVADNADYYARIVAAKARQRQLIEIGTRIVQFASGPDADPAEVQSRAMADLGGLPIAAGEPVVTLDTFERKRVIWLWAGRLALGKIAILDGDPDLGKSLITLDVAARVSTGSPMPADIDVAGWREPAGVVVCCAEDDIEDTIIPRLESHGGDLKRIATVPLFRDGDGQLIPLTIPRDLRRIERIIRKTGAQLLIIDPITAYLPEKIQTHNDASVRRALTPLADVAQRTGCAVVLIRHLNKDSSGGPALYRGGGSIAFSGAARTVLIVGRHPDHDGMKVLARVKGNLSAAVASLAYRLVPDDENETLRVAWNGVTDVSADALVRGRDRRAEAPARDQAAKMIRQLLEEGPALASKVIRMVAQGSGCSARTVQDAASKIGVLMTRKRDEAGRTTGWMWELPSGEQPEAGADSPGASPSSAASGASGYPHEPDAEVEVPASGFLPPEPPEPEVEP